MTVLFSADRSQRAGTSGACVVVAAGVVGVWAGGVVLSVLPVKGVVAAGVVLGVVVGVVEGAVVGVVNGVVVPEKN